MENWLKDKLSQMSEEDKQIFSRLEKLVNDASSGEISKDEATYEIFKYIKYMYFVNENEKLNKILDAFPEDDFLKADGLDAAIIGVEERSKKLIYSVHRVIKVFMAQGMDYETALEFYNFNVEAAYLGEKTPIFCYDLL